MRRRERVRRFEPRYGVSQAALDEEAKAVQREADDYLLLAPADLDKSRAERHTSCAHSWEHLQLLLNDLPENDQRVIQSLLFRDLYHVTELYLTYLRGRQAPAATSTSRPPPASRRAEPAAFSEFLFKL